MAIGIGSGFPFFPPPSNGGGNQGSGRTGGAEEANGSSASEGSSGSSGSSGAASPAPTQPPRDTIATDFRSQPVRDTADASESRNAFEVPGSSRDALSEAREANAILIDFQQALNVLQDVDAGKGKSNEPVKLFEGNQIAEQSNATDAGDGDSEALGQSRFDDLQIRANNAYGEQSAALHSDPATDRVV